MPDGQQVLLTQLEEGQNAAVLQLPAAPRPAKEADEQKRAEYEREVRSVAVLFRPVDGVSLRFEGLEYLVGVIFDHIIVNVVPSGRPLGRAST